VEFAVIIAIQLDSALFEKLQEKEHFFK